MSAQQIELEGLLAALRSSDDSAQRTQAEQALDAALEQGQAASVLQQLAALATGADEEHVRRHALVLVRRSAQKIRTNDTEALWTKLPTGVKMKILDLLLANLSEQTRTLTEARACCDTIADLDELDESRESKKIGRSLFGLLTSTGLKTQAIALHGFTRMPQCLVLYGRDGLNALLKCLKTTQDSDEARTVRLEALRAAGTIISDTESDPRALRPLVTPMLDVLPAFAQARDTERLTTAIQSLTELVAVVAASTLLESQFSSLVRLLVTFARADSGMPDDTRQAAVELITSIVEAQADDQDHGWPAVVETLLAMMTEVEEDADWSLQDEDDNDSSNCVVAESALDRMARCLPDVVYAVASKLIVGLCASSKWQDRHAGLSGIAVINEGCEEAVAEQIDSVLALVFKSVSDEHPRVRYASLYALAQLCTDLGSVVQSSHAESALDAIISRLADPEPRVQTWAALAIVNFLDCDSFTWEALRPRLDQVFAGILSLVSSDRSFVRQKALSALCRLADSATGLLSQHYAAVMPICVQTLMGEADEEEKANAMACAASFAVAAGPETFKPDAEQLVKLIAALREHSLKSKDADAIVYASLPSLVKLAHASPECISSHLEGLVSALVEDAGRAVQVSIGEDEDNEDLRYLDAGDGVIGVDGEAIDNKIAALDSLIDLAGTMKAYLMPYINQLLAIAEKEIAFSFDEDVRVSAAGLLGAIAEVARESGAGREDLEQLLNHIAGLLLKPAHDEEDPQIAASMFEALGTLYAAIPGLLESEMVDSTVAAVETQLQRIAARAQIRAQQLKRRRVDEEDEQCVGFSPSAHARRYIVELDDELLQRTGDALHGWIAQVTAQQKAAESISALMVYAQQLGKGHPNDTSGAGKRFGLRFAVDLVEKLGPSSFPIVSSLLDPLGKALTDERPFLRRAAAYGVGVIAACGGQPFDAFVAATRPSIIAGASVARSKDVEAILARDNFIAARTCGDSRLG